MDVAQYGYGNNHKRRFRQGYRQNVFRRQNVPKQIHLPRRKRIDCVHKRCPGEIRAIEIHPGQEIICQKSAFLASTPGVNMSVYFKKSLSGGLFGGEGFIMQKFDGEGIVFVELDGSVVEYNLAQGQQLVLDTGHLAMMDATCKMDVQTVSGVKNVLFGGEGLFNTVITGPGKVLVQTLPVNKFAIELYKYMPKSSK